MIAVSFISFQSTLPARGATAAAVAEGKDKPFQSTLPARGATHEPRLLFPFFDISIHAPRTGSDAKIAMYCRDITGISIHAPRTGSDFARPLITPLRYHFNPRSPHGERQARDSGAIEQDAFQSTLPARGATRLLEFLHPRNNISIHAPRTGSDKIRQEMQQFQQISIHAPRTGSDQNV